MRTQSRYVAWTYHCGFACEFALSRPDAIAASLPEMPLAEALAPDVRTQGEYSDEPVAVFVSIEVPATVKASIRRYVAAWLLGDSADVALTRSRSLL
ncbi:MAG TPA: hypothetical protein VFE35_03785 [Candidatus Cybelea sp.]|jgi:hypothetical protein|nr:hypothetical protein [Candidatus Cybelea sp.]